MRWNRGRREEGMGVGEGLRVRKGMEVGEGMGVREMMEEGRGEIESVQFEVYLFF